MNLAALVAAIIFAVILLPRHGPRAEPLDFRLMWSAGAAARGLELGDLYTSEDNKKMNDFLAKEYNAKYSFMGRSPRLIRHHQLTFTPALIAAFASLSTDSLGRDFKRFGRFSKILFAGGVVALGWSLAVPGLLIFAAAWLSTVPSWSFHMTMSLGNVGAMLTGLFMMTMMLLRGRRPAGYAIAGFLFTVLSALKPTFLFAIPMLGLSMLRHRRWTDVAAFAGGCAAGGIVAIAFPYFVVGKDVTWLGWLSYVPQSTANDSWLRGGTFIGKLWKALHHDTPSVPLAQTWSAAMNLVTFGAWFAVARNAVNPDEGYGLDAGAVSAGILLYLLSGPVAHSHYFIQAVPAAIVAMRPRLAGNLWERSARCALAFAALFLIGAHSLFRHYGLVTGTNHSIVTFVGPWVLLLLLFYDQIMSPPRPEDLLASVKATPA